MTPPPTSCSNEPLLAQKAGDPPTDEPGTPNSSTTPLYQASTTITYCNDPQNDTRNIPGKTPWKYVGYRIFSKWLATDGAFLMVRRFGALSARVALSMQDEIVQLEEQLDLIDETLSGPEMERAVNNGSFRNDPWEDRKTLVTKTIPDALTKYSNFINGYTQLVNRPAIHKDDLATVKNWVLKFNKQAIDEEETKFLNCDDDLIGIQPKARSWFRNILEATFFLRTPGVRLLFERKPREYEIIKKATESTNLNLTIWSNDKRVEGLSTSVIAVIGLGMLVGPLWWLAVVHGIIHRLAIITGFITIFFCLVAVATDAGVFNSLAAAAAYSAVLMVFLQVIPF